MDKLQTSSIALKGGLDTVSTSQEMLSKPGWARTLLNFEVSPDGGYRRVNGYTRIGIQANDTDDSWGRPDVLNNGKILGIKHYSGGFIVCQNDKVLFTEGDNIFLQLNVDMDPVNNPSGVDSDTMQISTSLPRLLAQEYNFESFTKNQVTTLIGVCPGAAPMYVNVVVSDPSLPLFLYKELAPVSGSFVGAHQCIKYKDQLVIAGMDSAPTEIYYSDILNPDNFEGGNAGSIGFNDRVTGLKMFRNALYVFCINSIHKVTGLETGSPKNETVTTQMGCLHGGSIQEIGGDLVFLGPDGLRTLSATQKIADVNLSVMSRPVQGALRAIINQIQFYSVNSVVIRTKSQYRIFFQNTLTPEDKPLAITFHIGIDPEGRQLNQFSTLEGFDITAIDSGYGDINKEVVLSGDSKGIIYYHDQGANQDGSEINFLFNTHFFDLGNSTIRKNVTKILQRLRPEGVTNYNLSLLYDYEKPGAAQPEPVLVAPSENVGIYDQGAYGQANYGAQELPTIESHLVGSGKTIALKIFPAGLRCDPFSILGFDLEFLPGGQI